MQKLLFRAGGGGLGWLLGYAIGAPTFLDGWFQPMLIAGALLGDFVYDNLFKDLVQSNGNKLPSPLNTHSNPTAKLLQAVPVAAVASAGSSSRSDDPAGRPWNAVTEGTICVGFWPRLVANIIDSLILAVPAGGFDLFLPFWPSLLFYFAVECLFFVWFWTENGATPGKTVMGLKVVDHKGQVLGMGEAFKRYLATHLSVLVLGLGFLWILWDSKHEGWHDKIAGTKVVKASDFSP